ncbi:hypothetical protein UO65_5496 [Actinokineospora spheciospongiae]|uniref:Lipopolysaccharide biosynthesis protein WzxC n=1 Tax=Actinokineospora spheciospongiae TaxID=909613 RepID=W7IRX5_9PSEU|nr:oligosaccharide flippase family protein [Actinokineospora spheciospongiae]EWC59216.1 hypothetical protein UO65_5496 [Actinokineospora spheciospongiae]
MTGVLGARAMRGSLWLGLTNVLSKGSQAVVTLALAALLTEGELGSVALTVALVNIGQVVQSMGVYDVISRTEGDPKRVAGTVLTLSVGVSAALALALALAAQPIATAVGGPEAASLVRLAAVSLPFSAIGGVQMALMHRDLDFRRRLLPDAGSAILGAVVTVLLALNGWGPQSVVIGVVATAVAQPLLGAAMGVRSVPGWDTAAARESLRWIAVVGPAAIVAILLVNLDYLAIGRVLGPDAVGLYSLAYRIAWMPYIAVAVVLGAVAFPVFTTLLRTRRRDELPTAVSRFTRAVLVLTGGLYLITALLADRVTLLGERWAPAAGVLVLLCAYGVAISILQVWYQAIKAAGHPRRYLALETAHLVAFTAGLVFATRHGMAAVALTQVVVAWALVALTWWVMVRSAVAFPLAELTRMGAGVACSGLLCAAAALVMTVVGVPQTLGGTLVEGAVLVLVYTGATLLTQRGTLSELRAVSPRPSRDTPARTGDRR